MKDGSFAHSRKVFAWTGFLLDLCLDGRSWDGICHKTLPFGPGFAFTQDLHFRQMMSPSNEVIPSRPPGTVV